MNPFTFRSDAATPTGSARKFLPAAGLGLLLLAAAQATAQVTAQDSSSGVAMKMSEQLNQVIEQGVATMRQMQQKASATPAAATPAVKPVVTKLKMDKINSRFVEKQDEIFDRIFHLTWSRCSLGQRWVSGKGCVGKVRQYTYDQAINIINARAGEEGNAQWRIPTRTELASLLDHTKRNQPEMLSIDSVAFPDMDRDKLMYWSSDEENNSFSWAILFIDGGVPGILYRSHRYAIRLVRSTG